MLDMLNDTTKRIVGTKQVLKAINEGRASHVFLGKDADGFIYHKINGLCEDKHIPLTVVDTMAELGKRCGIAVPTASAALIA